MAKYIQLNPYSNIVDSIDNFFQTHHAALTALMLRENVAMGGRRLRVMSLTKEVVEETRYVGMINISIVNEKFSTSNLITTKEPKYPSSTSGPAEVGTDFFRQKFFNEKEHLKFQISFKQFMTDNLGITNIIYSARYEYFPDDADPFEAARKTRDTSSLMWDDAAMVLATRLFWASVEPILNTWTPGGDDITTQTLLDH